MYRKNLKEHYNQLWQQSHKKIERQETELDPLIDDEQDSRYGITLLARPSEEVKSNIHEVLKEIKAVAPRQYYYPPSDIHVTVLSVISCYPGFSLDEIAPSEYVNTIQSAAEATPAFKVHFKGLTASPSCILVQGFPESKQLDILRNNLRSKFKCSSLQHSIDKRYRLQTAHLTVVRFRKPFKEPRRFTATVAEFRNTNFGSSIIKELELVSNDWYQRKENVECLHKFSLN